MLPNFQPYPTCVRKQMTFISYQMRVVEPEPMTGPVIDTARKSAVGTQRQLKAKLCGARTVSSNAATEQQAVIFSVEPLQYRLVQ